MGRMYRVLAFWTFVIALMALWGNLYPMSMIFFALTAIFLFLGYLGLSEKAYLIIFGAFLVLSAVGFSFYTFFIMPGGGHAFILPLLS